MVNFGIQLPIQAQSTIFVSAWERSATPRDLARIARTADQAGYAYVAVCDHVAIPRRLAETMSTTWYDNIATLGWLAAVTEHTRLLSHVHVLAYRHPAQTAHAIATIDRLSDGRVILGVGAGHVPEEFALLGADFEHRGATFEERIVAVKRYLTSEFVDDMGSAPRPVQQPRPPVWVGGSSPAAIRRAALLSDGWLPQGPPKIGMAAAIEHIAHLRAEAGETGTFAIGDLTPFLYVGEADWELPRGSVSGTAEHIAERLVGFGHPAVTHLQVRFAARSVSEYCEQLGAFAEQVAPLIG